MYRIKKIKTTEQKCLVHLGVMEEMIDHLVMGVAIKDLQILMI
jgi:hypothetical protein